MTWAEEIERARIVQEELAKKVRVVPLGKKPRLLAAVDAAFSEAHVFAAAVLCSFPGLEVVEETTASSPIRFPYVPGYLSFREAPAIIEALRLLRDVPDLVLVDGQGIAHPRGIGIASHIGVLLDVPTIGCAKSHLVGEFAEPANGKGSWSPLTHRGSIVGAVLRTRASVRPLFVSPGHRVDLKDCLRMVAACSGKYRIPEPLRKADELSQKAKRSGQAFSFKKGDTDK